jgi:hypothetical protein
MGTALLRHARVLLNEPRQIRFATRFELPRAGGARLPAADDENSQVEPDAGAVGDRLSDSEWEPS